MDGGPSTIFSGPHKITSGPYINTHAIYVYAIIHDRHGNCHEHKYTYTRSPIHTNELPKPHQVSLGTNRQSGKLFICKIAPERVMLLAMSSYKTNGGFQGPRKQRLGSHTKPGRSDWPYVANPTPKRRILQTESTLVVHLSASVRQQRYQQCERNHTQPSQTKRKPQHSASAWNN